MGVAVNWDLETGLTVKWYSETGVAINWDMEIDIAINWGWDSSSLTCIKSSLGVLIVVGLPVLVLEFIVLWNSSSEWN